MTQAPNSLHPASPSPSAGGTRPGTSGNPMSRPLAAQPRAHQAPLPLNSGRARGPAVRRRCSQGARLGGLLLGLSLLASLLSGCAALPGRRAAALPDGLSRDDLLTGIAACHLRRVSQNQDVSATDAVVIAAVERYGFSVHQMVERSNELVRAAAAPGQRTLLRQATNNACERLSALTGVAPALVRFDEGGRLGNTWVVVEGKITDGFAERIIARLRADRAIGLVINSTGGSLYEARRLGRYLRENGLRVAVNDVCTSACVDVLAGGIERYVTPEARLGIHQSWVPSHLSSHEGGQLSVVAAALYLREMGIDESVALAAAATPNDSMYWISLPEALDTRLATRLVAAL